VGARSTLADKNLFTGVGLLGKWEQMGDAYIIRPSSPPKSIILFIGGAFVGAAPQQWYRYLLEEIAEQGHVVVTTPYSLEFDYLSICSEITQKHDQVVQALSQDYGELPVIGAGHSCGALLQTLLSSNLTTPESFKRAANVLISFNNKPVKDAIPAFEQLVTPLAVQLTTPGGPRGPALRAAVELVQNQVTGLEDLGKTGLLPPIYNNEFMPFLKQAISPLNQIPGLFERIAEGVSDFTPSTPDIQQSAREAYEAPRTLLVRFSDDSIDETDIIGSVLSQGSYATEELVLPGTHVTPCTQDLLFETPLDILAPPIAKDLRDETRRTVLSEAKSLAYRILDFVDTVTTEPAAPQEVQKDDAGTAGIAGTADEASAAAATAGEEDVSSASSTPELVNPAAADIVKLNVSEDSDFTPFL